MTIINTNKEATLYNALQARIESQCTPEQKSQFWIFYNKNPPRDLNFKSMSKLFLAASEYAGINQEIVQECIDDVSIAHQEEKEAIKQQKKEEKEKKKQEEENIIFTGYELFTNSPSIMIEEVYDEQTDTASFAIYNPDTDTIEYSPEYIHDGITYKPIIDEEVKKKAILLPSKAEDYESEEKLDNEIKRFIQSWLDVKEDFVTFAVWNIKKSWVFDRFHTVNYLRAMGDTGQGKSRFLDTLGALHYKPLGTSGATTAAPIFRIIAKWKPTLIIDEADFKNSDESHDIIKIINCGYEKNKFIMRCDQNDATKVQFFDPYCPKLLATRRPFDDKATESRCITTIMTGTHRKDIEFNLNKIFYGDALKIRNMLLMYRFKNYFKIDSEKKIEFDFGDIEPRVQQIVTSYIRLFEDKPEQMQQFKDYIKKYQEQLIEDRSGTMEGQIVETICKLIDEGEKEITCALIINKGELRDNHNNLLKPRALSSYLKVLGIEVGKKQRIGKKTVNILEISDSQLCNLKARYGVLKCSDVPVVLHNTDSHTFDEFQSNLSISTQNGFHGSPLITQEQHEHKNTKNDILEALKNYKNEVEIERFKKIHFKEVTENEFDLTIKDLLMKGDIVEVKSGFIKINN